MADDHSPRERLIAIWKAVCASENIAHDAKPAENHIRTAFGDLAGQSFTKAMKLDVPPAIEPKLTALN